MSLESFKDRKILSVIYERSTNDIVRIDNPKLVLFYLFSLSLFLFFCSCYENGI